VLFFVSCATSFNLEFALEQWVQRARLMDDEALALLDEKLRMARERIAAEFKQRKESEAAK
jgi:hypothetical protein